MDDRAEQPAPATDLDKAAHELSQALKALRRQAQAGGGTLSPWRGILGQYRRTTLTNYLNAKSPPTLEFLRELVEAARTGSPHEPLAHDLPELLRLLLAWRSARDAHKYATELEEAACKLDGEDAAQLLDTANQLGVPRQAGPWPGEQGIHEVPVAPVPAREGDRRNQPDCDGPPVPDSEQAAANLAHDYAAAGRLQDALLVLKSMASSSQPEAVLAFARSCSTEGRGSLLETLLSLIAQDHADSPHRLIRITHLFVEAGYHDEVLHFEEAAAHAAPATSHRPH